MAYAAYLKQEALPDFWMAITDDYERNAVDASNKALKQNDQALHKDIMPNFAP